MSFLGRYSVGNKRMKLNNLLVETVKAVVKIET